MLPFLIIKTGQTIAPLLAEREDFEQWIIAGTGLAAARFKVIDVYAGEEIPGLPADYCGVFVTGSPAFVTDLAPWSERSGSFLRQAVQAAVPVLAICYGHQLLAHCAGGGVGFHPRGREIGTVPVELSESGREDILLGQLPPRFEAQVSHLQSVLRLPPGAVHLAGNDFEPNQAFRLGASAWGIQFHPEFSARTMAAYVRDRRSSLIQEGLDADAMTAGIVETGAAASVLSRFVVFAESLCTPGDQPPEASAKA